MLKSEKWLENVVLIEERFPFPRGVGSDTKQGEPIRSRSDP